MKSELLVIKGKSSAVLKQLKSMTPEEFEALKSQALSRKGLH